jgi:hypothetical protein
MAIAPLAVPQAQAYSAFDFTPLARLGNIGQPDTLATLGARYPDNPIQPTAPPSSGQSPYASAISKIESGGKYDLVGPSTKSGDRAYGKYQVMGANIPDWTKEALGTSMTPDQFLASPAAQDAVFNAKFGQYVDKYGPRDASKAWFAGEGGMKNPDASDLYGTTVQSYADKFVRNLGQ